MLEFMKGKKGFYHLASNSSKNMQINELKKDIANFYGDELLSKLNISSWTELFTYIGKHLIQKDKVIIAIDEFSYMIKSDKSILSALQIFIDRYLRKSKSLLIIAGSLFGLMSEKVLSYTSPLYGRRDRDILVKQLDFYNSAKLLNMSFEESLKTYLLIGGIPEYLRIANKYKNANEFIQNEFTNKIGYFYREPYFILSEEFKEIKTYFSILEAIAYGNNKPTEIANYVGIKSREIYPYLELMISHGFISRVSSAFSKGKRGIYIIQDPMLDTWFNIVHKNREEIEFGNFVISKNILNKYLGKRFEMFCRDLLSLNNYSTKPWWHKDKEIDIVGIPENGPAVFGEAKWKENLDARIMAESLYERIEYVPYDGEYEIWLFGKSFKKKVRRFKGVKVRCVDLKGIERMVRKRKKK